MKKSVIILLSIAVIGVFMTTVSAKKNNKVIKSNDGIISVVATENGLKITKKHDKKFTHVTIHVAEGFTENFAIETDEKNNTFVYPFVEKNKTYSVFVTMMDNSWGNWTQSQSAVVTAEGGLGNCRTELTNYSYNNKAVGIELKDYKLIKPENIALVGLKFQGNIYYGMKNKKIDWGKSCWGMYSFDNGIIDLSNNISYFMNTDFAIQLEEKFIYDGILYTQTIISNEKKPFHDNHTLKNVTVSEGILIPHFTAGVTSYEIRGIENQARIIPEYVEGVSYTTQVISVDSSNTNAVIKVQDGDEEIAYEFNYIKGEKIEFDGQVFEETFFDDFDGDTLNTKKWKYAPEEERQPNMKNHGWWSKECVRLDGNGNLIIEAKKSGKSLISGAITTEKIFEQSHGYYEVKFKCDNTSGMWYAFWLLGQNDRAHIGNGATNAAEIDIFELIPNEMSGPNLFGTTIHWDSYGPEHQSKGITSHDIVKEEFYNQWHVVKFIWGETSYKLYLDEKLLWEMDASVMDNDHFGGMCNGENHIIISSEFGDWGGPVKENMLPAKMMVDYVRVGK